MTWLSALFNLMPAIGSSWTRFRFRNKAEAQPMSVCPREVVDEIIDMISCKSSLLRFHRKLFERLFA
jgi:hypothetical protein